MCLVKNGAEKVFEIALNESEKILLYASANAIQSIVDVMDGMNKLKITNKIHIETVIFSGGSTIFFPNSLLKN